MRLWSWILLGLGTVTLTVLATTFPDLSGTSDEAALDGFRPNRVLDPFPPMSRFPTVAAREADGLIEPGESVLGVEVDGEARAYPIDMIQYINKEVLNDTLGDEPIAVTWCDLCQAGIVYSRNVAGRTLTFRVSGMLWKGNMVMEDLETGTLWSQLAGRGLQGELGGVELESYTATLAPWKTWRARYPETSVLVLDREPITPPQQRGVLAHEDRFPTAKPGEFLVAVACGDEARGWTLEYLRDHAVVNASACGVPILLYHDRLTDTVLAFERELDGCLLTFRLEEESLVDEQTGSAWDPATGQAVSGPLAGSTLAPADAVVSYAEPWLELHPQTEIRGSAESGAAPIGGPERVHDPSASR